jgi:hypothetical protein
MSFKTYVVPSLAGLEKTPTKSPVKSESPRKSSETLDKSNTTPVTKVSEKSVEKTPKEKKEKRRKNHSICN